MTKLTDPNSTSIDPRDPGYAGVEEEDDDQTLTEAVASMEETICRLRGFSSVDQHQDLLVHIKRLEGLLQKTVSERERYLVVRLKKVEGEKLKLQGRLGGALAVAKSKEKDMKRLQFAYEELCKRSDMPFPPCAHGRDPHTCLSCVANWLGRNLVADMRHPNK